MPTRVQVQQMRANDRSTIYIDFEHLVAHDYLLADAVRDNHYRFDPYLAKAVQNFVRKVGCPHQLSVVR